MEQGAAPVVHMDLDRALSIVRSAQLAFPPADRDERAQDEAAMDALRALVDRARQYVAGPTSGRLAALAQVLQEPVPDTEKVVQSWLLQRDMVVITRETAAKLGLGGLR